MKGQFTKPQLAELRRIVGWMLQQHAKGTGPQTMEDRSFWNDVLESAQRLFPNDPDLNLCDLRIYAACVRCMINHFGENPLPGKEAEHKAIVEKFTLLYNHVRGLVDKQEGIKDGWHRHIGFSN